MTNKMLIPMVDGGMVKYDDDSHSIAGCSTCNFGSEYITDIYITLTRYHIHIRTNQMYSYVLSEGDMMRIFLSEYNTIQAMTEQEFVDWLKVRLLEIADEEDLEAYDVVEIGR